MKKITNKRLQEITVYFLGFAGTENLKPTNDEMWIIATELIGIRRENKRLKEELEQHPIAIFAGRA